MATDQNDSNTMEFQELENMAAGLEQEQAQPQEEGAQPSVSPEMQAYGMARMFCEVAARGAQIRWECLDYSDEIKDQGAQVLVPVLLKYNVQNELFAKYAEEFAAGAFFAGVIFTSYQKVKAHQAAEKAKEAAEKAANEAAVNA